jgi:hypothetical protein
MARTTKTLSTGDTAELAQFAHGEDVGHGVDHDCPACRVNRQALKAAGLKASDVKGLEGGKPPAGDGSGQPPQAATAFIPPIGTAPEDHSIVVDRGTSTDPNDRPIETHENPLDHAEHESEERALAPFEELDILVAGTPEYDKKIERMQRRHDLHRKLHDELHAALEKREIETFEIETDTDIIDAILSLPDSRCMLMKGFIPDDQRWSCELQAGPNRAHIKQDRRYIAISLAALMILDPKAGAAINSAFEQLRSEEQPPSPIATAGMWSGLGMQP